MNQTAPINTKLIESLAQIILSLSPEERNFLAQKLQPSELSPTLDFTPEEAAKLADLLQAILIGLEQIQRGEYTLYTEETLPTLLSTIRHRGQQRLQLGTEA
jgi:hypothetical protein